MDQRAPKTTWPVQEAKNRFSKLLEASHTEPQIITRHGREAGVLLSPEEYKRLKEVEVSKKPSFAEALLAIPQGDEEIFEPMPIKIRDIDL